MLTEAMCKLMGFTYAPGELYWQQGRSTESDFIYVTTQTLTREHLAALSEEELDEYKRLSRKPVFGPESLQRGGER